MSDEPNKKRWRRAAFRDKIDMAISLGEADVKVLLYELCVRLGFCLPQEAQRQLERHPPSEVEAFADAVYAAEGEDPHAHPHVRRQVCECIAAHFAQSARGRSPWDAVCWRHPRRVRNRRKSSGER